MEAIDSFQRSEFFQPPVGKKAEFILYLMHKANMKHKSCEREKSFSQSNFMAIIENLQSSK